MNGVKGKNIVVGLAVKENPSSTTSEKSVKHRGLFVSDENIEKPERLNSTKEPLQSKLVGSDPVGLTMYLGSCPKWGPTRRIQIPKLLAEANDDYFHRNHALKSKRIGGVIGHLSAAIYASSRLSKINRRNRSEGLPVDFRIAESSSQDVVALNRGRLDFQDPSVKLTPGSVQIVKPELEEGERLRKYSDHYPSMTAVPVSDTMNLRFMTWNLALMPNFLCTMGDRLPLSDGRVNLIAEEILRLDPDIACLQEAFGGLPALELVKILNDHGYHVMQRVGGDRVGLTTVFQDSGLMIISKYPFKEDSLEFTSYYDDPRTRSLYGDSHANKGVAFASVVVKSYDGD